MTVIKFPKEIQSELMDYEIIQIDDKFYWRMLHPSLQKKINGPFDSKEKAFDHMMAPRLQRLGDVNLDDLNPPQLRL